MFYTPFPRFIRTMRSGKPADKSNCGQIETFKYDRLTIKWSILLPFLADKSNFLRINRGIGHKKKLRINRMRTNRRIGVSPKLLLKVYFIRPWVWSLPFQKFYDCCLQSFNVVKPSEVVNIINAFKFFKKSSIFFLIF